MRSFLGHGITGKSIDLCVGPAVHVRGPDVDRRPTWIAAMLEFDFSRDHGCNHPGRKQDRC